MSRDTKIQLALLGIEICAAVSEFLVDWADIDRHPTPSEPQWLDNSPELKAWIDRKMAALEGWN